MYIPGTRSTNTHQGTTSDDTILMNARDRAFGNGGNDTFDYSTMQRASNTQINDFSNGDLIDLSGLGVTADDITSFQVKGNKTVFSVDLPDGHPNDITIKVIGVGFDISDILF
jgi:hypothetical protein